MKKILVDTSLIIDYLRVKDKEKSTFFLIYKSGYSLSISIITHAELYSGKSIWKSKKAKNDLEDILAGLEIILLKGKTSEHAGKLRANYGVNLIDALIAAEAIESSLPLATFNQKHFEKIRGLKLVKIEK